jgi:hypothetical protein
MTEEAMAAEERTGETGVAEAPVQEPPQREEPYNTVEATSVEEGTWEPREAGAPVLETPEREEPLNAEEATVLVVSFLKRMEKIIVTPIKAVQTDSSFVVDVELKDAMATVQINVKTWKIVEYSISPLEIENKPLPFPPKKIAMALAGVAAVIVFLMAFSFFRNNMAFIISSVQGINPDIFIYGAAVIIAGGVALWWRRRG